MGSGRGICIPTYIPFAAIRSVITRTVEPERPPGRWTNALELSRAKVEKRREQRPSHHATREFQVLGVMGEPGRGVSRPLGIAEYPSPMLQYKIYTLEQGKRLIRGWQLANLLSSYSDTSKFDFYNTFKSSHVSF